MATDKKKFKKELRNTSKIREKRNEIKAVHDQLAFESLENQEDLFDQEECGDDQFEDLSLDEAFVALTEIPILAADSEEERTKMEQEFRIMWGAYITYLRAPSTLHIEKYFDQASVQILALRQEQGIANEYAEADVSFFVSSMRYRWSYLMPKELQDKIAQNIVRVNHNRSVPPIFIDDYEPSLIRSFKAKTEDRMIAIELRKLDKMVTERASIEERTAAVNRLEPLLAERFSMWLAFHKIDPYIRHYAHLAGMMVTELYTSLDFEPEIIASLKEEAIEKHASRFSILVVATTIERFLYAPFVLQCLLRYLNDIKYCPLAEEADETLRSMQAAIVTQLQLEEGDGYHISRKKLLAAEYFGYSFYNYHAHQGNLRYDTLMPRDVAILELAVDNKLNVELVASKLNCSIEAAKEAMARFELKRKIVDAGSPAKTFKAGVTHDIKDLLKNLDPETEKELVRRICYRGSDLLYLFNRDGVFLDEDCHELVDESEAGVEALPKGD